MAGKAERAIRQALKETGRHWSIEQGGSHRKVFIDDQLVTCFSNSEGRDHGGSGGYKNIIAKIRKFGGQGQINHDDDREAKSPIQSHQSGEPR